MIKLPKRVIFRLIGAKKEDIAMLRDEIVKPEFTIIGNEDLEIYDCSAIEVEQPAPIAKPAVKEVKEDEGPKIAVK